MRQLSSWSRWLRPQDSLHDIIGEDEDAREVAVQEDLFCFGDDLHRRDARHSHPCEDRRDAVMK